MRSSPKFANASGRCPPRPGTTCCALAAAGLARRVEPAGSPARYEARAGDNHHHVVCRGCGAIADVDCAVGGAPCLEPAAHDGFVIDEAEVTYWGLCPACQAPQSVPSRRTEVSA